MAAPVLEVDVAVEAVPADVPLALEALEELGEVVVGLLPLAALVAAVGPATREVVFKQDVEDPALMVNGADWATSPVLSRRVRPIEVPAAMFATQVTEVLFCWPRFSRAAPLGLAPGRMLKK
jgi:hypothetical protein